MEIPDPPKTGNPREVPTPKIITPQVVLPPEQHRYRRDLPEIQLTQQFGHGLNRRQVERVAYEVLRRRRESLRLWRPMPIQEEFHACGAYIRIFRGGNRAGKTVTGCVELARCVTGQDPHKKYPKTGTAVVVGKDTDALANVIFPKLFFEPAFDIIRDPQTGLWRSAQPWNEYDVEHKHLWKPAPPLIPRRFCDPNKDISYIRKGLPRTAFIKNGEVEWKILFFSGESKPKPGFEADFGWPDEELLEQAWIQELRMRLIDRQGKMIWTLTAENMSAALQDLQVLMQQGKEDIVEFQAETTENVYLDQKAVELSTMGMTEEEYDVKIRGGMRTLHHLIFPEYEYKRRDGALGRHGCEPFPIPPHWNRYIAIDPGVNPAAAIYMAVPPPERDKASERWWQTECTGEFKIPDEYWKFRYLYDESYLYRCNSDMLAEDIKVRVGDQRIHRFLIDPEAASKTEVASGLTIGEQYRQAFKRLGLESERQGCNFTEVGGGRGMPKVRRDTMSRWLRDNRFKIMRDRCRMLDWEMKRWAHKKDRQGRLTDEPSSKNNHAIDAACYLFVFDPDYEGIVPRKREDDVIERLLRFKNRKTSRGGTRFGPRGA